MKLQLHATGLESLARCGVAWERRNIRGEKIPAGARAAVGTAVDASVRRNLQNKVAVGAPIELDEAKSIARDTLSAEWESGVRLTEEDMEDAVSNRDKAIDMSVNLSAFHHETVAPSIQPTHVARRWVLDVDGADIQIAGEIDIQTATAIRDTKTSGKSPVKSLADESLQLSVYALAVRQLDGKLPETVHLDYLVQTPKRGDTKFVPLSSVRTIEQLSPVLARIEQMDSIIRSGLFTPAPIGSWWCSARYCGYFDTCKYAARPVSVAVAPPPDLTKQLENSLAMSRA